MEIGTALELPVVALPMRSVATPGKEAGVKTTVPSIEEVAVDIWVASSWVDAQRP